MCDTTGEESNFTNALAAELSQKSPSIQSQYWKGWIFSTSNFSLKKSFRQALEQFPWQSGQRFGLWSVTKLFRLVRDYNKTVFYCLFFLKFYLQLLLSILIVQSYLTFYYSISISLPAHPPEEEIRILLVLLV